MTNGRVILKRAAASTKNLTLERIDMLADRIILLRTLLWDSV